MAYLYLLLTLLIGALFGYLVYKIKVPGGLLVGAIVGAALLNICFGAAYMPNQTKLLVQIIAGAFIGCSMEKSDVKRLPKIIKPTIIMISALLILNLAAGVLIHLSSPLDLVTSFMSVVPGGISDTPIIAAVMGADAAKVAVMQIVRQVLGIGVFPLLIRTYDDRRNKLEEDGYREAYTEKRQKSKTKSWQALVCTLIVAAIFGLIGNKTGIPAGAFVFSIVSVLILKLLFDFAYMPKNLKKFAQILSGCYLGSTIVMSDILDLRYLLLPLFIIIIGYMANCFITGIILSKTCGFTRKEAMLITTPAGASDMALISSDMGVENTDVIILQILRAVIVMTFFPQIISLILHFFG
ncbi:MAG: membrane-spanning protein [Peptococcaceae bacterium]|nr:membrane-spanning protein [Peptococcaceae bacterium]